jgi:hypothetical protein
MNKKDGEKQIEVHFDEKKNPICMEFSIDICHVVRTVSLGIL